MSDDFCSTKEVRKHLYIFGGIFICFIGFLFFSWINWLVVMYLNFSPAINLAICKQGDNIGNIIFCGAFYSQIFFTAEFTILIIIIYVATVIIAIIYRYFTMNKQRSEPYHKEDQLPLNE